MSAKKTTTPADLLVIGLGNPGSQYEQTRHNAGLDCVELVAKDLGVDLRSSVGKSRSGHVRVGEKSLALGVPSVFMNLSGESVAPLVRRYVIEDFSKLVIVHDELDLPAGKIQVKLCGGLAGHNGLKSIKQHLKDDAFARIRIGIDRPEGRQPVSDYVLRKPSGEQRELINVGIARAAECVMDILNQGVTGGMNLHN